MSDKLILFAKRFSLVSAFLTMILSLSVFISWMLGLDTLPQFVKGFSIMTPNTSIAIFFGSTTLLLVWRKSTSYFEKMLRFIFISIISLISIGSLAEFYTGRKLAINHILLDFLITKYPSIQGQSLSPSANTAIALILLICSLVLYRKYIVATQVSAILLFSVAALAFVGHAYRITHLYHIFTSGHISGMSIPTALSFLLLSLSIITNRPEVGILKFFHNKSPANELLSRFALAMIFIPLLFGIAAIMGAGKNDQEILLLLTAVSIIMLLIFSVVTISSAKKLIELDNARTIAEEKLRHEQNALAQAQEVAELGSWEWIIPTNELTWSDEVFRLFGLPKSRSASTYENFLAMVHPEDRKLVEEAVNKALQGGASYSIDHRIVRISGELLYVHEQAAVDFGSDGKPIRMLGTVQNITERKKIEEALSYNEKLFSQVIEIIPIGVWLLDKSGKIYRCNEAGKQIWAGTKYVGPEEYGEYVAWWEDTGKKIKPEEWSANRAIKYGQSSIGELIRIQCFDGSTKVIQNSSVPLKDQNGIIIGAIVVNEDITDRRNAQLKAEEAANRVQSFLENANDSVITVDKNGKITFLNRQVELWFGYSKEELLGKEIEILIPDRLKEVHIEQRVKYAQSPVSRAMGVGLDIVAKRKDGTEIPVEISLSPTLTKDGYFTTAVIRDISERKNYEEQQRLLNAISQELAETIDFETTLNRTVELAVPEIGDWCLIHILDSGKKLQLRAIKHADPAQQILLEKALGLHIIKEYATSGVMKVAKTGMTMFVPSLTKKHIEEIFSNPETRKIFTEQLKFRSFISVPLKSRGNVLGTLTIGLGYSGRNFSDHDRPLVEDLAQRVSFSLENGKLYSEALNAIRDREDVVSVVSHDLKNPLSSIRLSSQFLEKQLKNKPEHSSLLRHVENILSATNSMNGLIYNILDIEKIKAGTFSIDLQNIMIEPLLKSVKDIFTPLAQDKKIDLRFIPETFDLEMICDPNRVIQIFSNLIGNAIKFTPPGGKVIVKLEFIDHELHVCVEDNGPGMSAEFRSHLFDRYWQAKETSQMGSGLGLYITKGIITAHGGKIWVESTPGKGSQFYFTLPEKASFYSMGIEQRGRDQSEIHKSLLH